MYDLEIFEKKMREEGIAEGTINMYICNMKENFEWLLGSGEVEFKRLYRQNILEYVSYLKNIRKTDYKTGDNHSLSDKTINLKLVSIAKYNRLMQPEDIVVKRTDYIKIHEAKYDKIKNIITLYDVPISKAVACVIYAVNNN